MSKVILKGEIQTYTIPKLSFFCIDKHQASKGFFKQTLVIYTESHAIT